MFTWWSEDYFQNPERLLIFGKEDVQILPWCLAFICRFYIQFVVKFYLRPIYTLLVGFSVTLQKDEYIHLSYSMGLYFNIKWYLHVNRNSWKWSACGGCWKLEMKEYKFLKQIFIIRKKNLKSFWRFRLMTVLLP